MNMKVALFAFISMIGIYAADTKAPADDWKPASSNQPGKEYPKVNPLGHSAEILKDFEALR